MRSERLPADVDRREWLRRLGALAAAALVCTEARAAAYPDKPVRLIVAAPPGSGPDAISRMLAEQWTPDVKAWIENQPGLPGGGTPEALASFQASETRKWRSLIQTAHIKAD